MTNKKRTVSKRYNKKERYNRKKLTKKKRKISKKGGANPIWTAILTKELDKLSKRQLRQRATALSVDEGSIQEAHQGPTPKADLIKLIIATTPASARLQQLENQPPIEQREIEVKKDKIVIRFVFDTKARGVKQERFKKDIKDYLTNQLFSIFKDNFDITKFNIDITHNNVLVHITVPKDQWKEGYDKYESYVETVSVLLNNITVNVEDSDRILYDTGIRIVEITLSENWIGEERERLEQEVEEERQRLEQEVEEERQRLEQEVEEERQRLEREEEGRVALRLQSVFRGRRGREVAEGVKRERDLRERTVGELQRKFRERKEQKEVAARKIQSVQRGIVGREAAEGVKREREEQIRKITGVQERFRARRDRRILESKRIFWTDEKGEINTKKARVDRGEYSDVVRASLEREEIGIPILLQIGDEVEVRLLNFPTNTDPWNTGPVISTVPSLKVKVEGENIENWPIVRKDDSIKKYINELQGLISVGDSKEERLKIRERMNRGRIILKGEEVHCNFGEGDEGKCNLNPKCRYVSGNYGELKTGNCLTKEDIIQQLESFIQELEDDAVSIPSVETYDNNIRIYKELKKILKDTTYDEHISRTEQMKDTLTEKKLKEGDVRMKRERREERKEEMLERMHRINEGRKALGTTMGEIKDRFLADEKQRFKQLKKNLTKKKKPKKKIDRVIKETRIDLRDKTVDYTLKQKKNKKPIKEVKQDYMNFVDDYYKTAIQKDKMIINQFIK